MALTDIKIRKAAIREKAYKLADEKGLYLLINPNESKFWRYKYRFGGKEKLLAIGVYPEINLAEAREQRNQARKALNHGTDPSLVKKEIKHAAISTAENSFEVVAREWYINNYAKWSESYREMLLSRLEKNVFPWLGKCPINQIEPPELLVVLRRIEKRGALETAHKVKHYCGKIFRFAIAEGRAQRDPSADLREALKPVIRSHYATIKEPKAIGELMRAIDGYQGNFVTKCALKLAPLLFVRPGELRKAEWSEFDITSDSDSENPEWRIPAEKMKMRITHLVPLSSQVITILRELQPLTGNGRYLFPAIHNKKQPMSDNTINSALRRLGYTKEEITGHGFRSMASTRLNEQQWNPDAIERQLAHIPRDSIRATYNYAQYLPVRRKMMQHWADYLDSLREIKA